MGDVSEKEKWPEVRPSFAKALENLLNAYDQENGSNTPDFILAEFLLQVLNAWNLAVRAREEWYGRDWDDSRQIDLAGELLKERRKTASLRAVLRPCFAILRHKNVSPPMAPGKQEELADRIEQVMEDTRDPGSSP